MSFQVSANGSSVQSAQGPQSLLSDKTPLTKLDTTKLESFQTISILFNSEPPQTDPGTFVSTTQLYQFAHGYTYIPDIWMAWQNPAPAYPSPPTSSGASATTFNAFGDESASSNIPAVGNSTALELLAVVNYFDPINGPANYTMAFLYCIVDATNVTIYVNKTAYKKNSSGNIVPIYLVGVTANIRLYVFTEPANTIIY